MLMMIDRMIENSKEFEIFEKIRKFDISIFNSAKRNRQTSHVHSKSIIFFIKNQIFNWGTIRKNI